MSRLTVALAAALLVGVLSASDARAGIADSPLPVLVAGKRTVLVYSVPGVLDDGGGIMATFFSCTSTDTATLQVGVQVFDSNNQSLGDPVATSVSLMAGHSVLFGTRSSGAALFASNLNTGGIGTPGAARIIATSTKLICTAFVADASNYPPTSMVYLTIVKKTKQKGE